MNRAYVCLLVLMVGCGKKEDGPPEPAPARPAGAASASASAAVGAAVEKVAAPLVVEGAYTARQAEVRVPDDAPPFLHPDSKDGVGEGSLELTMPSKDGPVVGIGKGALGAMAFEGWLSGERLDGTVRPTEGAAPAMWGLLQATVEGAGDARVVKGTLRVSGRDGKLVREAAFALKKKGP